MRYLERRLAQIEAETPAAPSPPRPPTPAEERGEQRRAYFRDYGRLRRKTAVGRRAMHASNLRARHGMTLEAYQAWYLRQGGRCAICGDGISRGYDPGRESEGKRGPRAHGAHIDHDHACCPGGKSCGNCIRGLLCARCNGGLERFRDNAELMRRAADYVGAG